MSKKPLSPTVPLRVAAEIVIDRRNEILVAIAPRHDAQIVKDTSDKITAFLYQECLDLPTGTVVLAMQHVTDALMASMLKTDDPAQ